MLSRGKITKHTFTSNSRTTQPPIIDVLWCSSNQVLYTNNPCFIWNGPIRYLNVHMHCFYKEIESEGYSLKTRLKDTKKHLYTKKSTKLPSSNKACRGAIQVHLIWAWLPDELWKANDHSTYWFSSRSCSPRLLEYSFNS